MDVRITLRSPTPELYRSLCETLHLGYQCFGCEVTHIEALDYDQVVSQQQYNEIIAVLLEAGWTMPE